MIHLVRHFTAAGAGDCLQLGGQCQPEHAAGNIICSVRYNYLEVYNLVALLLTPPNRTIRRPLESQLATLVQDADNLTSAL